MPFTYEYARPAVTVDVALFDGGERGELRVLLIQRKRAPGRGRWALPGGFVEPDEDLAVAARRELREETGIEVAALHQLGAYGTPGRDPRGHTISVVFLAGLPAKAKQRGAMAGDDASACAWHAAKRPPQLAFDHTVVLRDARKVMAALAQDEARFRRALFGSGRRPEVAALRAAARG